MKPTSTTRRGEPVRELYAYLRDETSYPLDLVWSNMIRTMHPFDFTRNLGLTRVIQPQLQDPDLAQRLRAARRIALAMHLYFMDMLPQSLAFAANFPPETDVFISTDTQEKKEQIEQAFAACGLHSVTGARGRKPRPRCGRLPVRPGPAPAGV